MLNQEKFRKMLVDRQNELERKLKPDIDAADRIPVSDVASGELTSYDNHPADSATQLYEREKDLAFDRQARDELQDIRDALKRLDNGTYGIDEITGEQIPEERLIAIPTARTGVASVPPKHSHQVRPAEESVIEDMARLEGDYGTSGDFNEMNAFDLVSLDNDRKMIHEDGVADNDEERVGTVENVDALATTDIEGYTGDDNVRIQHNSFEKR
jgi:sporulation protein, yteA family